jgi:hypothetical protein
MMVQINSAETGRAKSARQWTLRPESKGKEKEKKSQKPARVS